jgi:hypothetical protein
MKHQRKLVLAAALAFTGLAACGGDDDTTTDTTAQPPAATAPATTHSHPDTTATDAPTATAVVEEGVLTIVLSDYAFGGLPESVPAGTKLAVENISEAELHEVVAFKVHEGETRSAEELLALPEEELLAAVGPMPTTVLLAAPGAPQIEALGDGTLSEPGRYLLLCGIPTGVDPEEYLAAAAEAAGGPPEVDGGPPHFIHGMFADLTVV